MARPIDEKAWDRFAYLMKDAIEYGLHCNDYNHIELEQKLKEAADELGESAGMPKIDWEAW